MYNGIGMIDTQNNYNDGGAEEKKEKVIEWVKYAWNGRNCRLYTISETNGEFPMLGK